MCWWWPNVLSVSFHVQKLYWTRHYITGRKLVNHVQNHIHIHRLQCCGSTTVQSIKSWALIGLAGSFLWWYCSDPQQKNMDWSNIFLILVHLVKLSSPKHCTIPHKTSQWCAMNSQISRIRLILFIKGVLVWYNAQKPTKTPFINSRNIFLDIWMFIAHDWDVLCGMRWCWCDHKFTLCA